MSLLGKASWKRQLGKLAVERQAGRRQKGITGEMERCLFLPGGRLKCLGQENNGSQTEVSLETYVPSPLEKFSNAHWEI